MVYKTNQGPNNSSRVNNTIVNGIKRFPTDCKFPPQACELLIIWQLPDLENIQHIYDIACFKCPLSIRIFQTQEAICNKAIQLSQWSDGLWVRRL